MVYDAAKYFQGKFWINNLGFYAENQRSKLSLVILLICKFLRLKFISDAPKVIKESESDKVVVGDSTKKSSSKPHSNEKSARSEGNSESSDHLPNINRKLLKGW